MELAQAKRISENTRIQKLRDQLITGILNEIPDSQLIIYENCYHSIAVDVHDEYIHDIRNFMLQH